MTLRWENREHLDGAKWIAAFSGQLYVGFITRGPNGLWTWEVTFTDRVRKRRGTTNCRARARATLAGIWSRWLVSANLKEIEP